VGELGDLLVGISVLVGSLASAFVLVWNTVRGRDKPEKVAKSAAEESAAAFLDAIADGDLTPEELAQIRRSLSRGRDDPEGGGRS
jgi:hypothetical protein